MNTSLNELSAPWAETMLRACWQGGLFALAVWLVSRAWRAMPASLRCVLWCLVGVKMLVTLAPIVLPLPVLPPEPIPQLALAATSQGPPTEPAFADIALAQQSLSLETVLLAAWTLGIVVRLGLIGAGLLRIRALTRRALPLPDPALAAFGRETAASLGLGSTPSILVTPAGVGALTFGGLRQVVLLSQAVLDRCTPSELRVILTHEIVHLKRRDAWLGLIPQLVQVAFFFNPVAWLVCREFELDRETACDEATLRITQTSSESYGRLLLKLGARPITDLALCTPGVSSHFRNLHRRITMLKTIRDTPRHSRASWRILPAALIAVACVLPWSLTQANPDPQAKGIPPVPPARANTQSPTPAKVKRMPQPPRPLKSGKGYPAPPRKVRTSPSKARKRPAPPSPRHSQVLTVTGQSSISFPSAKTASTRIVSANGSAVTISQPYPQHAVAKPTTKTVTLQHTGATTVASTLQKEFTKARGTTIYAHPTLNSVTVRADELTFNQIRRRIHALDGISSPLTDSVQVLKLYLIKNKTAAEIATTLRKEFPIMNERKGYIYFDPEANAIIVQAGSATQKRIADRIAALDK